MTEPENPVGEYSFEIYFLNGEYRLRKTGGAVEEGGETYWVDMQLVEENSLYIELFSFLAPFGYQYEGPPPEQVGMQILYEGVSISNESFLPEYKDYWCDGEDCRDKENFEAELEMWIEFP